MKILSATATLERLEPRATFNTTVSINPEIGFVNFNFRSVFYFGNDINRSKRRMPAFIGIKGRNTHQTMHPMF